MAARITQPGHHPATVPNLKNPSTTYPDQRFHLALRATEERVGSAR